jgi:cytosine deaminase
MTRGYSSRTNKARNSVETIRLKPPRLYVIKRGQVIAETPEQVTGLHREGRPKTVNGADYAPRA